MFLSFLLERACRFYNRFPQAAGPDRQRVRKGGCTFWNPCLKAGMSVWSPQFVAVGSRPTLGK
jgi:hypothetical protein